MDISRKTITDEKILEKESEIVAAIDSIKNQYEQKFIDLGYELTAEYIRRNDYDKGYTVFKSDEQGDYENGYNCRAKFTIRTPKDETAKAEESDSLYADENETESAEEVEDEDKRTVAYTELMILRTYTVFWSKKVTYCDDYSPLTSDLDEFLEKLTEKSE